MAKHYSDIYFQSEDGLKLYARDYNYPRVGHTILCLHGLTRNSADFSDFCAAMYPNHRFIVPDQRGRGLSDYDQQTKNYNPSIYVRDMFTLLDLLSIEKVLVVGTSMGGLMAMMMAAMQPERFTALVLNDVGPEVDQKGLDRIKEYAGNDPSFSSWDEAVAYFKKLNMFIFPNYTDEQWFGFTENLCVEKQGVPVVAYDSGIMEPIIRAKVNAVPPDLWAIYSAASNIPICVVRGELSDILSRECVLKMKARKPDLHTVEVANVGHAPMLNEVEVLAELNAFIADAK